MASPNAISVHPQTTRRRHLSYMFHPKHHGGDSRASRWCSDVKDAEEFSVFDLGDFHDIADERANLFGVLRGSDGFLRMIGLWNEQIGEFPFARPGENWHGYPCWSLNEMAPQNRRNPNLKPGRIVFDKLLERGLITEQERKRLINGDDG